MSTPTSAPDAARPFVLISGAVSVDGYIDDISDDRLILSNPADLDRVDQLRAESDAIMVGAGTIRIDNPKIVVSDPQRRTARISQGRSEHPLKVTITTSGDLDTESKWFHTGGDRLIYTTTTTAQTLEGLVAGMAEVVSVGNQIDLKHLLADLAERGVKQLMVEGGETLTTALLVAGLVDEIQLAIAPLIVGGGPRWTDPAPLPWPASQRMELIHAHTLDDMVILRYRSNPQTSP